MRRSFIILLLILGATQLHSQYKNVKFGTSQKPIDLKNIESWFSYIPSQTMEIHEKTYVSVEGFFMMRFETPNMLYRLFIDDLKAAGKLKEAEAAYPDTNIWFSGMDPYKQYYFQHPAYNEYPVVGVSKDKIKLFCDWLSEKVQAVIPKRWNAKKVSFRLPTEHEWMFAALGGKERAEYAWDGIYLRRIKLKNNNTQNAWSTEYYANFCRVDDSQITRDDEGLLHIEKHSMNQISGDLIDGVYFTAPVVSYWPNEYGLYNICGNVREFVKEDGFTKGGSWMDPGADLRIRCRNTYKKEGFPCEGFRLVAEVE